MFKIDRSIIEWLNKFFTDAYKILGFVILAAILMGLVSYFTLNLFYLTSTHWVAPVILSANHEKVIQLNGELTRHGYRHERLIAERGEIRARATYTEHALQAQEAFRTQLRSAVKSELEGRKSELAKVNNLMGDFQKSGKLSAEALKDYKDMSYEQLAEEYKANLIDRQAFVDGTYTLTQVDNARLTRESRKIQAAARREQLMREVAALESVLDEPAKDEDGPDGGEDGGVAEFVELPLDPTTPLTFEVLAMLREYRASSLEAAKLRAEHESVDERIAMLDASIARYEQMEAEIKRSPYLRAMEQKVAIAFVPYENLEDAQAGTKIYGCSLGLIWCRQVGSIAQVLEGEVTATHPLYNEQVRGQMVELQLDDPTWAEKKALFTGRAPLFI